MNYEVRGHLCKWNAIKNLLHINYMYFKNHAVVAIATTGGLRCCPSNKISIVNTIPGQKIALSSSNIYIYILLASAM